MFREYQPFVTIFLFTIFTFSQLLYSQALDTLWTTILGGNDDEFGYFAEQTNDGGYILTGWTKSFGTGLNDIWLVKTNSSGDTVWTKTFGGVNDENSSCVHQTNDGGYIIFGETDSFDPTYWKAWLIKTDAFGDTIWTSLLGENRHYFIQSGIELLGGNLIFVGYTKASGAGQEDIWLVKTNESGDIIWTETFGGARNDLSTAIQQTNDGGFIIAASTNSFGAGNYDIWLIRTNADGDTIWTRTYGGTDTDHASDVKQTDDNGFIIAGSTRSFGHVNNYNDAWLIKTDFNGDTIWTKTFGGDVHDGALSVQQTSDGGYIIVGGLGIDSFNRDVWLIKTNSSGDTLWTKTFGGGNWDIGRSIEPTNDGGYVICGDFYSSASNNYDIWLLKTEPFPNSVELKENSIPERFNLEQNYPNPFNPSTKIGFRIADFGLVNLNVYDILGNEIATLINKELPAGEYEITFNVWTSRDLSLPSGMYFYQLKSDDLIETKKMLLLK